MRLKTYLHGPVEKSGILGHAELLTKSLQAIKRATKTRTATELRQLILSTLRQLGWSDRIRISPTHNLTLTAKQGRIALCLQTGNMARFYADLLKLQAHFVDKKIDAALYLLPTRAAAVQIGQNLAHFERMSSELSLTFHKVITVPIVILGFEEEAQDEN